MEGTEQLHQAFCRDDVKTLREAFKKNPELRKLVNEPIGPFDSPPILGARSRAMLDFLLEEGADINAKSKWWAGGFCLLDTANDDLAEYAISRGAIVEAHAAARLGKMERLRELIQSDPKLVHARGGDGKMPLHFACNIEVAKFLLDHGADINSRDIDHESTAAQHLIGDHPEVARFLVERGAQSDIFLAAALGDLELTKKLVAQNPDSLRQRINKESFPMTNPRAGGIIYTWTLGSNLSPRQVARKFDHETVFKFLMQESPAEVRLVDWCWLGKEAEAKQILSDDPQVLKNLTGSDHGSVVHAARENETKAAFLMLQLGFPIDVRGQHGGTPLHWAAWHGNAALVKALLARGAASQLKIRDDEYKATPLDWSSHGAQNSWHRQTGNYEAVQKLLQVG